MQLLGTLDGMEPVVKQISGHRGSLRFLGPMEVEDLAQGRTAATPSTGPPAPKCALIRPGSGYR